MKSVLKTAAIAALAALAAACGGGSGSDEREPINTDYSTLGLATSRTGSLHYATAA
jgi:hypothetical protein